MFKRYVFVLLIHPKTVKQINREQCTGSAYLVIDKTGGIPVPSISRRVNRPKVNKAKKEFSGLKYYIPML